MCGLLESVSALTLGLAGDVLFQKQASPAFKRRWQLRQLLRAVSTRLFAPIARVFVLSRLLLPL